jgi:hypothetical protein
MTTKNDITGDVLKSKPPSDAYRDAYGKIFGAKKTSKPKETDRDKPT